MVEKMELLHITGPREDIDRVADAYLSKYEIHFENATTSLNSLANVRPFVETNLYKESFQKAEKLWKYLKEEGNEPPSERMEPSEAGREIDRIWSRAKKIQKSMARLRKEKREWKDLMHQLEPFRELDYEFRRILQFRFIAFRFGRISRDYYQRMERYISDTDYVLFYECHSDENFVWGAYFVPESYKSAVDAVCMSFHFERIYLPDSFEGTPDTAYREAEAQIKRNEEERKKLYQQMQELLIKENITVAYYSLKNYCENFDIRKYAVCTKTRTSADTPSDKDYYILYGWMSEADAERFIEETKADGSIQVLLEKPEENVSAKPPTRLKNPKIFAPFQMFVEMYGLPAYHELDPTIFIALTYTFMFGAMFGDVGQGLVLAASGYALYKTKKMKLAGIVSIAGLWSTFFGFMYGSVFGFEDWLKPLWMRPMENIMTTLLIAVGFGMGLILVAMIINIINAVREKELGRMLFDQSGLAGLLCYGGVVGCIALYLLGYPLPAAGILAVLLGLPLLAIFLKEPLSNLVEHKSHIFPGGSKGMFFVEAFVELFDVVLSYATNSISFVRVGAFALSHAGMMGVVLSLAGYESGSPNMLVVVLGNILVSGLEGLVVGIQVLRLEYYEMFSRFYKGTGKPFTTFFKKKENGGNEA